MSAGARRSRARPPLSSAARRRRHAGTPTHTPTHLLHVADDGPLGHGAQRLHIAHGQGGLLTAVHELRAGVCVCVVARVGGCAPMRVACCACVCVYMRRQARARRRCGAPARPPTHLARVQPLRGHKQLLLVPVPVGVAEGHLRHKQGGRQRPGRARMQACTHARTHAWWLPRPSPRLPASLHHPIPLTRASGAPRPESWMMSVTTPLM